MNFTHRLSPLIIPLGQEAHEKALELAASQSTLSIGKQVYLKSLAVYAVNAFLRWVEIETDLSASDSWSPLLGSLFNTADLVLPQIGRLECCPIVPEEIICRLPTFETEDLIGYVGVKFGNVLDRAQILGFTPVVDISLGQEQLSLELLQPLESLEEYLNRLKAARTFIEEDEDPVAVQVRSILSTRNITEVVAQLEKVYRSDRPIKWRYAGADVLIGSFPDGFTQRESSNISNKNEIQKIAQNLMSKLAEIWELHE